jgi:hypothetical protein
MLRPRPTGRPPASSPRPGPTRPGHPSHARLPDDRASRPAIVERRRGHYALREQRRPRIRRPVAVGRVVLTVAQSPAGQTVHIVSCRTGDGADNLPLGGPTGQTADNQRLVVDVDPSVPPLRYLRVDTTTSPSWVAWREIEVIPRGP